MWLNALCEIPTREQNLLWSQHEATKMNFSPIQQPSVNFYHGYPTMEFLHMGVGRAPLHVHIWRDDFSVHNYSSFRKEGSSIAYSNTPSLVKWPLFTLSMTREMRSEENPFINRRKKLVEDAHRISRELDAKDAAEKERAKAENEQKLIDAKNALINDIESLLAELPPLQLKTFGSAVIISEAFAWFYDENKPFTRPVPETNLASGSHDNTINLWNANTGECLRTLKGHTNLVLSVAFSPDGTTLASGSDDNTINLWNAKTGRCLRTLEGHTSPVWSVAFSPDGTTLASGSRDNTIKLWNANTGECLRTLKGHTHFVYSVAFSPDVQTFLRHDLDSIFKEVRAMLREAEFGLSTKDGIEFTVSWNGLDEF